MANKKVISPVQRNENYIHSSIETFEGGLEKKTTSLSGFSLAEYIESLKNNLVKTIYDDIRHFRAIENAWVNEIKNKYKGNEKVPFHDREGYLKYLNDFRKAMSKSPDVGKGAYSLINLKNIAIQSDQLSEKYSALVQKLVPQITEINALNAKETKGGISSGSAKRLQKLREDQKTIENLSKKEKDELNKKINKFLEDYSSKIKDLALEIAKAFNAAAKTAQDIIDPSVVSDELRKNKEELAQIQKTSAKKVQDILAFIKADPKTRKVMETALSDINNSFNSISSRDAMDFLTVFYNTKARDWMGYSVQAFQLSTQLGYLFEPATIDTVIQNLLGQVSDGNFVFLAAEGGKDIKATGAISAILNTTPIDIQTSAFNYNGYPVKMGWSLKLKEASSDIKLDATPVDERPDAPGLWNSIFNITGKDKFLYQFIRANVLALQVHSQGKKGLDWKYTGNQFLEFEKEIVKIAAITRLLVGFYEKVDQQTNQYKTSGRSIDELFYGAYIFGLDHVVSVADVLEGVLNSLDGPDKIFTVKFINVQNTETPSVKQMEDLYKAKRKAIKQFGNAQNLYPIIQSDSDVISLLKSINDMLLSNSLQGANVAVSMTPSQMQEALKKI